MNVLKVGVECESFTTSFTISNDLLLVYKSKYYQQVYLDNCAYKTVCKEMTHFRDDSLFETDED